MSGISSLTAIGNGLAANDGTGDALRSGADKINGNNTAIVTAVNNLAASQAAGRISYLTKADMDADLAHGDGTMADVTNDATTDNNRSYRKSGASGAGSWAVTIDRVDTAIDALAADLADPTPGMGADKIGFASSFLGTLLAGLIRVSLINSGPATDTAIFRRRVAGSTRMHIEPNGQVPAGTVTKLDLMHDPLDGPGGNATHYRILNFYTYKDKTQPQGAASIINTKAVGSGYFGFVPPMHFAINDDTYVPMSVYFFSGKTDNQWYLNYVGMHVAGVVVAIGDRMSENNKLYEATTAGTTGATPLTHTSGSASDGSVTWLFLRDYTVDAGAGYFHPLVMIGNKSDWPKFGHWDARMQVARPMVLWNGTGKLRFLKADSTTAWEIFQTASGNTLEFNNGSGKKITFDSVTGNIQLTGMTILGPTATVTNPGASWSVTGLEKVVLALSSGTLTITNMTGGSAFQEVKIIAGSAGITFQHGAGTTGGLIKLKGGANKTLAQYEGITFMANSSAGFFTEI